MEETKKLAVIDGETLMDMDLPPTQFCIRSLLPQGVVILGGSPKVGKSWLVLDLCIRVAKGEEVWNMKSTKGTTLYFCLEDTYRRVQERLYAITDEVPPNAYFVNSAQSLSSGLTEQIEIFLAEHPDTVLIVIDTFQIIRKESQDSSYASDYDEIRLLKELADRHHLSILLVHHLRKQGDKDPLNKLSGTTGIIGAVDAVYVLEREDRDNPLAKLICTGRDIEHREITLRFDKQKCVWNMEADTLEAPELLLPEIIRKLIEFMKTEKSFIGGNTEFSEKFISFYPCSVDARRLKGMMNHYREQLAEYGVTYTEERDRTKRTLKIEYNPVCDAGDVSDAEIAGGKFFVTSVTFVTDGEIADENAKTRDVLPPAVRAQ